jgi:hypothetical protein
MVGAVQPSGSQPVSNMVVLPERRARASSGAVRARDRPGQLNTPSRPTSPALSTRSQCRAITVSSAWARQAKSERKARSPSGRTTATVSAVRPPGTTSSPEASTPAASRSARIRSPQESSPTQPITATGSPRAASAKAV